MSNTSEQHTDGRLKILMLPHNVSSDMDYRVEALLGYSDLEIRAYTTHVSKMIPSKHCRQLPAGLVSMNPFKRIVAYFKYLRILKRELEWADIIHWYWDFNYIPLLRYPLEFRLLRNMKKKGLIMWCGSEIRNPDMDKEINPFYRREKESGNYEYHFESAERSFRTQSLFHKLGFVPLEFIGMGHYIRRELFPKRFRVYQVIGLQQYQPRFPSVDQKIPLVVHSASRTGGKGTKYVLAAIESLKRKYTFDFQLIHGMSKMEALDWVANCDVFIDQLITGSHGTAAVEAMALGKPVICYINPVIGQDYPKDFPIHNANPDTIEQVLEKLILDSSLRHQSGHSSRAYVKKYHDDAVNAEALYRIYKQLV